MDSETSRVNSQNAVKSLKLNILLDFACELGTLSKLVKVLKEEGFVPRIVAYNILRLRVSRSLSTSKIDHAISTIGRVASLINKTKGTWRILCIETWIEEFPGDPRRGFIKRLNGVCVYVRPGTRKRVINKLVWSSICPEALESPIPESLTRVCVESPEETNSFLDKIREFIYTYVK